MCMVGQQKVHFVPEGWARGGGGGDHGGGVLLVESSGSKCFFC